MNEFKKKKKIKTNNSIHFQILRTIPFDKVNIKVITIHLNGYYDSDYQMFDSEFPARLIEMTTKFLNSKSYRLEKIIDQNYIYSLFEASNDIRREPGTVDRQPEKQRTGI